MQQEIEKYQWFVDILSDRQKDFPYTLVQILQDPEDINEFIYPEIKNWSEELLNMLKDKAKSRSLDFEKLSTKEKLDLVDFNFTLELQQTLADKKLNFEKLEKPTFELTTWRDREANPPKALEKYKPIVEQINKIIKSIPEWANLL